MALQTPMKQEHVAELSITPQRPIPCAREEGGCPPEGEALNSALKPGKRDTSSAGQGVGATTAPKRPRYNDKSFGDLTVSELEDAVREATALKRQLAAKEDKLASSQSELETLRASTTEQNDVSMQADRVKRAIKQTLVAQMVYQASFKEQLQGEGREIVTFVPNVSAEVIKALGGELGTKNRYSDSFFGVAVTKISSGQKLALARPMTLRYYKSSFELKVDAAYELHEKPKQSKKAKAKAVAGDQKYADADGEGKEDGMEEQGKHEKPCHEEGGTPQPGAGSCAGSGTEE